MIAILHIAKMFPHEGDSQLGSFVKSHIEAVSEHPHVIALLDHKGKLESSGDVHVFGTRDWSIIQKVNLMVLHVKQKGVQLVHFHGYGNDIGVLSMVCRWMKIPYVHTEHGSMFLAGSDRIPTGIKKNLLLRHFANAARVMPVSQLLADGILALSPQAKIDVVPNIIKTPEPHSQRSKAFCVVADAVFDVKRQDLILKAFRAARLVDWELHFIGGGPDLKKLEEMAAPYFEISVLGRLPHASVLERIGQYHGLALFSTHETFGMVVLEGLAAGLHVASTSHVGCAPFATEGVTWCDSTEDLTQFFIDASRKNTGTQKIFSELSAVEIGQKIQSIYDSVIS